MLNADSCFLFSRTKDEDEDENVCSHPALGSDKMSFFDDNLSPVLFLTPEFFVSFSVPIHVPGFRVQEIKNGDSHEF